MATDPRKIEANKAHQNRMVEKGWRRVNVWLPPAVMAILAALVPRYGGAGKAIEASLKKLWENEES